MDVFNFREQHLIEEDKISGEEDILGKSLNIFFTNFKGEKLYVPRNKFHKVLAAHENELRKTFYESANIMKDYSRRESFIFCQQNEIRKNNLEEGAKHLDDLWDKVYLCSELDNRNFLRYPNFAIATLSKIVEDEYNTIVKLIKILNVPRYLDLDDKHSEETIFWLLTEFYKENRSYEEEDIILDIHSTMAICTESVNFFKYLLSKHKKLYINMSYHANGNDRITKLPARFYHKRIELTKFEHLDVSNEIFLSTITSSGINKYPEDFKDALVKLVIDKKFEF